MKALLESRPLRGRDVFDLLRSAAREQLWPTVGHPGERRAVLARLLATSLLTYVVSVLSVTALLAVIQGRLEWFMPLWVTLDVAIDLLYVDYGSALVRLVTFWWAPTLAAIGIAAACRRASGRALGWSAAATVLSTAVVGLAVTIVVHGGSSGGWLLVSEPARLIRLWPRLAVIAIGSGVIGFVAWWIGAGPMRAPVSPKTAEASER
jgi:hypothetical protein